MKKIHRNWRAQVIVSKLSKQEEVLGRVGSACWAVKHLLNVVFCSEYDN